MATKKKTEVQKVEEIIEAKAPEKIVVAATCAVNVRKEATLQSDVAKVLYTMDKSEVYSEPINGFYKLVNGDGYVMAEFCSAV